MQLEDMQANAGPALKLLKALANEQRLYILCMLHQQELTVSDLLERLALSQSALSQHLAWLRRDQLVSYRKEGVNVYYRLASNEVESVIALLHQLYCSDPAMPA